MHYIGYDRVTGKILSSGTDTELPQDNERCLYREFRLNGETDVVNDIPVKLPPSRDELLVMIRRTRDDLLARTDKVWAPDYTEGGQPLTEERKNAYLVYRQALRDITTQEDLSNLIWPILPANG